MHIVGPIWIIIIMTFLITFIVHVCPMQTKFMQGVSLIIAYRKLSLIGLLIPLLNLS